MGLPRVFLAWLTPLAIVTEVKEGFQHINSLDDFSNYRMNTGFSQQAHYIFPAIRAALDIGRSSNPGPQAEHRPGVLENNASLRWAAGGVRAKATFHAERSWES